jgi:PadR family transcriptional regulator PadR
MEKFKKQLNKGLLELSILKLLDEEDQYGYSIMTEVDKRSNQKLTLKEGTLYPILYRLEDQDYIESYWKTEEELRSKPRKYYQLTKKGKMYFEEMLEVYLEVSNGMKNLLGRGH